MEEIVWPFWLILGLVLLKTEQSIESAGHSRSALVNLKESKIEEYFSLVFGYLESEFLLQIIAQGSNILQSVSVSFKQNVPG